jgi:glycosyltransferase involved in cell wall biosynthesis
MHLAICAIFKNEAPYLREWIEFHRLVGVEQFHLYQNRSDDGYQSVLQPYIQEGLVQVTEWPELPPCQIQAYQHFISLHKGKPWCATIGEALESIASQDWGAIGVNWMCFGASRQEEATSRPVIERFTLRPSNDFPPNKHIKSIVRMDRVQSAGPNSHQFNTRGGTFSELGHRLTGAFTTHPTHSRLRINHYHTKSREEYMRRIARGNADGAASRSSSEFETLQADEVDDRTIWHFLPELKRRIEQRHATKAASDSVPLSPYSPYCSAVDGSRGQLPRDFASFRNYHEGETMLVCGCGTSLRNIVSPERFPTIGVNDVGRLFDPDYLVVINPRNQFSGDRFRYVEASNAQAVFTQLDLGIQHPNVVRFHLGKRGGTDVGNARTLPYTRNSPYVALCLAIYMGAKRVGLIGVDFTEHHFFAATGRHPLAGELHQIDNEYGALAQSCRQRGVEILNLSVDSRLTAFPKMSPERFVRSSLVSAQAASALRGKKVFFVNYRFLSCGEVFSQGLRNAAEDLGIKASSALWDDPDLPAKLEDFGPDLHFVVHGRNYSQRWKSSLHKGLRSAVWLLDEPYEVDDTGRFSNLFDTTFVCDPGTIHRHKNAHFLPVCYDPANYWYHPGSREHRVGFVGGGNPAREQMLAELARRGLLSYAIGGPWRTPEVRRLSPAQNIPAIETANLYRQTQIVVNVFRTAHHFNREHIPAASMNPRIYEALACGCIVVSERRPEIEQLCPEMPVFDSPDEMACIIEELLADPARFARIRKACIRRLTGHTYAHRLYTAVMAATEEPTAHTWVASSAVTFPVTGPMQPSHSPQTIAPRTYLLPDWEVENSCVEINGDVLTFRACKPATPGSEEGLIGTTELAGALLSFEVQTERGATFVAKVHQLEQRNQASNSYHLMIKDGNAYVARHNQIFQSIGFEANLWHSVVMICNNGTLDVEVDGKNECRIQDSALSSGYCFLGIKSGVARVRGIKVTALAPDEATARKSTSDLQQEQVNDRIPVFDVLYDSGTDSDFAHEPAVSIITTVYDRVSCLEACLQSVRALTFESYEHILVGDAPPLPTINQLRDMIESNYAGRQRLRFVSLRTRANDWGISPASAGLSLAAGKYVCFLSDDNGYEPEHFERLVSALDADPGLGFAYSGCLYDGRVTLNHAPPSYGRIDLGQPLFRRELFERHFDGRLPFRELAWDWKMIQHFLQNRVRWKHIAEATFIFRLAKYPHLMPAARQTQRTRVPV